MKNRKMNKSDNVFKTTFNVDRLMMNQLAKYTLTVNVLNKKNKIGREGKYDELKHQLMCGTKTSYYRRCCVQLDTCPSVQFREIRIYSPWVCSLIPFYGTVFYRKLYSQ